MNEKVIELISLYAARITELQFLIEMGITRNSEEMTRIELELYRMVIKDLESLLEETK